MNTRAKKISEKRAAANRRNAHKSTGPRTKAGKRRACMNHYKHGFYATPDNRTRQEMFRVGEDPDLLARFERKLTLAWQPSDDMQAMLVADLALLYADKAQLRKVLRATRLGELREQESAIARVDLALAHEEAISEIDLRELGYRGMKTCQTALDESRRLLDELFLRNSLRQWGQDFSETFALLYGEHPHGVGRMIIDLFRLLAEHPEAADRVLEQPHPGPAGSLNASLQMQLAMCIERERLAVMFEERDYQTQKAAEMVDWGSEWLPGSDNWGKAQLQQARVERLIEAKIKLLIRLKRLRHSLPEDFTGGLGSIDDGNEYRGDGQGAREQVRSEDSGYRPEDLTSEEPKLENPNSEMGQPAACGEQQSEVRDAPQLTARHGPGNEPNKMLKNEERSHQVAENKGHHFGTNPITKPT